MLAVMVGPPQRPALRGGGAEHSKEELHRPRGRKTSMREITVIKSGDGEHPHPIQRHRHRHRRPTPTHPEHAKAARMEKHERSAAAEVHPVLSSASGRYIVACKVRIKPLPYRFKC